MQPPDPSPSLHRITSLHHYYETVRPSASHRFRSRLTVFTACASPLASKRLVPAVPCKRLHPTHAPSTPATARTVIRLLAGLSQEIVAPLVSTTPIHHNDASSKGSLSFVFRMRTCSRSCLELLIRRSPPRLFTAAARTGLRPAPESRSRGAVPHHSHSFTARVQSSS